MRSVLGKFVTWCGIAWITACLLCRPASGLLQYSAAELLRLRGYLAVPPPVNLLRLHPDIALLPRRRYTHRGSRRSFHSNDASAITSIWSTTRRPRRPPERAVNSKTLAIPARLTANASPTARQDNHSVNFGLLNIRSLTNKGSLIHELLTGRKIDFLCLTETWQQPGDFSQLNESTPHGYVYICQPRGSGRGGGLAIIHRETWKVQPILSTFQLPEPSEISDLITKSKSSTCQLDPLPTTLVKSCLPSLLPIISAIINSSLSTGTVPPPFKVAAVTPILKKPGSDPSDFNNLRPISNLPFISKILEKIVASQLHSHLSHNSLYEHFQSGFRPPTQH
ncbi:hypothetical protein D5F01_LYC15250 [Larimichthys crocea]|uniref:Endonuclease/exonuclease/phosphatase domain-containing protein n=1 Tax=Larimichthys crocea TaxID=215358 RepID=A0A6G0I297_LARCR|nr:hypothetical protein D5F01_LYC15250 [Larimichthys crocea]